MVQDTTIYELKGSNAKSMMNGMSIYLPEIIEHEKLREIKESVYHSSAEKQQQIQNTHQSFLTRQTNSFCTILNCTNSMIGSAALVLPLFYIKAGLLTAMLFAVLVGIFNFLTARLILKHYKRGESDFSDLIKRILGARAYKAYSVVTVAMSFVGTISSFLLIANVIYSILAAIIPDLSKKSPMTFSKFSYQWTGVILAIFLFMLYNIRRLSLLLKIASYGIYCVATYICFVTFKGILAIWNGEVSFDETAGGIHMLHFDYEKITTLTGIYAFAFLIHPSIVAIMKYNKHFEHNIRDMGISYSITGLIYIVIGVMGAFAINSRPLCKPGTSPATIMECFSDSRGLAEYITLFAQLAVTIQLISVVPIINFVGRSLFFGLFYQEDQKIPTWQFVGANLFVVSSQLILQMLNTDPSMVIAFSGTVCGFLIVYVFPIIIHFKRIQTGELESESLLDPENEFFDVSLSKRPTRSTQVTFGDLKDRSYSIGLKRWILYGFLIIYGLTIMVIEIHNVVIGH